ncbi:MAG: hypothetical protein JSV91_03535 [Phycisphaerales bacterium]|nr:MAG: hypothetical protein JSV91_03535 [Phycisphaerales bacterium]
MKADRHIDSAMTSRERLLCAIDGGRPDRLPISAHQWQQYHLDTYLGGMSDLEAFAHFGMDAQIQYPQSTGPSFLSVEECRKQNTPQWRDETTVVDDDPDNREIHHSIVTPEGTLTYRTCGNRKTTWITERLIRRDEDVELIRKYMPVHPLDPAPVSAMADAIGDRGILRGTVWGDQAGCWQHACCLMETVDLILRCFDDPAWVHALLEVLLEKKLQYIESLKGARFDLIETGGGAGSSTVISPALHEEFCLPYDRQMHDALHDLGFRVTYHTCGGTLGIEELIVANDCDVSETLAPKSIGSNQEPWEFAAKVRGRLALIGGVDQFNICDCGTAEGIRRTVRELFEKVGPNGGYVCSLSDHFFDTAPEKLRLFAEAGRECVY